MAGLHSAGARLRRTFQYPAADDDDDDDGNDSPSAMDEQEQDKLIKLLTKQNTLRNEQFARLLLLLPLSALLAYINPLLHPSKSTFSILAISSLLITAFLLYKLPPTETGIFPIDAWAKGSGALRKGKMRQRHGGGFTNVGALVSGGNGDRDRGPLEMYLPYMNLTLVLLLMLMGVVRRDERGGGFGWVSMGNLPGLIYSVVVAAKVVMAGVDPERELTSLRYDYKGA